MYNHLWAVDKEGSYYTLKNGHTTEASYLQTPANSTTGESVFTASSKGSTANWILEPYTGDPLQAANFTTYTSNLVVGEEFTFHARMYSSSIGVNGPVQYLVLNADGTATDKATINSSTGKVQALKPGQIRVGATFSETTTYWYRTVTIEESLEGTYYFKNLQLGNYMQIKKNADYSNSGEILELWDYNGEEYQRWNITYVREGYYKITSVKSGLAISVQSAYLDEDEYALVQEAYNGSDRQLWKFTMTNRGSYIIRPKSGESYSTDWCMCAGYSLIESNIDGRNVEQRAYTNDYNYKDEWMLEPINRKAIIIVPGITCSSLQNENGTKVWLYVGRQDQIACDENGNSVNDIYPYNPDNYGILDMYKNVYNTLTAEYSNEYDVIFFAYDWRMSCADAAAELEALTNNYDSCVLVAHSMGGIVASSYLAKSHANRAKTDKIITIGTPFTGAPKALYVMETGRLNWITEDALNLSQYAPNIPALYELFPTQKYFNRYSRFIEVDGVVKTGYTASWNYMKTLDWAKKSNGTVKPMFAEAETFHNTLFINGTHVTDRADVDTYKIIGVEEDTITCVAFDANNEYDFYYRAL